MNNDENQLYRRVDEILFYMWDPIGVKDIPEARDEYHSYVPKVFKLVLNGSKAQKIADYLNKIESVRMGLGARNEYSLEIAQLLLETKDVIFDITT